MPLGVRWLAKLQLALGIGGFVGVVALAMGGCAGDYPLAPTRCDRWCEATKVASCYGQEYDPAGCVVACEKGIQLSHSCDDEMDEVIACYNAHPESLNERCTVVAVTCAPASQRLSECTVAFTNSLH